MCSYFSRHPTWRTAFIGYKFGCHADSCEKLRRFHVINQLSPQIRVLLEELIIAQSFYNISAFTQTKIPLSYPQAISLTHSLTDRIHIQISYLFHIQLNIVKCKFIARQRVAKRIPVTHVHATIGFLLLGNGEVNMPSRSNRVFYMVRATYFDTWHVFSVGTCWVYITRVCS
jgi:hypothetical protein